MIIIGDNVKSKGQALVEYILIIVVISIIAIGLISYFKGYLKDALTKISCPLVDQEYKPGNNPGEGKCVESEDVFD